LGLSAEMNGHVAWARALGSRLARQYRWPDPSEGESIALLSLGELAVNPRIYDGPAFRSHVNWRIRWAVLDEHRRLYANKRKDGRVIFRPLFSRMPAEIPGGQNHGEARADLWLAVEAAARVLTPVESELLRRTAFNDGLPGGTALTKSRDTRRRQRAIQKLRAALALPPLSFASISSPGNGTFGSISAAAASRRAKRPTGKSASTARRLSAI
jgi:hypothetical protein